MIERMVVAWDDSDKARRAFEFALEIAAKLGAELYVLSVAQPPEPPVAVEMDAVLEAAEEYYQRSWEPLRQQALAAGVAPVFEVRVGHPADQIVRYAAQSEADMIVMGHRGRSSFIDRWLLGSISKRVLSYATCTVTIVR
jgi:nucleotide-binding universal stress UspA family protein